MRVEALLFVPAMISLIIAIYLSAAVMYAVDDIGRQRLLWGYSIFFFYVGIAFIIFLFAWEFVKKLQRKSTKDFV